MRKLWLIGVVLALASCGAKQDTDQAEAQVAAFHRAYEVENFAQLWDRSAPTMKELTPRAQFLELMHTMRGKLGAFKSARQVGWNVNYATGGSQITLTYETTFANGPGTETFVYDTSNPPRLMGWHVVSPALLESGPAEAVADKAKHTD